MHYVMKLPKSVLFGLCLVIAACSDQVPPERSTSYQEVVSLPISSYTDRTALEAEHGGKVLAWYPENKLAILGLYGGELSTLADANTDVFKTPEVSTLSIYNNGYRTWSGGNRAWSGGYSAWGASTTRPTTFTENTGLWNQIRLVAGQKLAPNLGRGVKVAVIDSGIDLAHPAFAGKLAPSSEWKDFVGNDASPQEVSGGKGYGHGTAVAGVILQVAPNATILPLRVIEPDGTGDLDKVISAVDWAIQKGAKVINLSLGTNTNIAAFRSILDVTNSRGVAVIASTGNNRNRGLVEYPAAYDSQVVGTGSVDANGNESVFTSTGSGLNIMAPGELVYSAFPGGQVAYSSGTSFAAPMVTGAYALALGQKAVSPANLEVAYMLSWRLVGINPTGTLQVDTFLRQAFLR